MRLINQSASARQKRPIRLDQFVDGSRFEDAVRLYIFDAKLRLLALNALERIELAVRVDVAYLLGKYEPCAHHKRVYGGELPIWVAIEVWDFGMLSKLYSGMKLGDRDRIAQKYGVERGKIFASWLRGLNFIRNVSAHHSRLWNVDVLERSSVPKNVDCWELLNNQRPFLYFCFMQQMLRVLCPNSSWSQRFADVLNEFPSKKKFILNLADFGLVKGWEEWDIWKWK